MPKTIQRELAGIEDILTGFTAVSQTRNGTAVILNGINAETLPYSSSQTIKEKIDADGGGDMLKSVYDTDDSGVVDNAETVTGFTVGENVAAGLQAEVTANTAKVSNVTTDLSITRTTITVTVESSDGTNAEIPAVTTSNAGVMTRNDKIKLNSLDTDGNDGDRLIYSGFLGVWVPVGNYHNTLVSLQGGSSGEYYHLTASQVALVDNAVLNADIGATVQAHSAVLDSTTASFTTAEETKLSTVEQRANHTGTQLASTISDLGAAIDTKTDSRDINTLFKLISVNTANLLAGAGFITHTNATGSTYINRRRVLKTSAIDETVFESEGMRGSCAVTNYAPFSEDCLGGGWVEQHLGLSTQDGTLAPDGTSQMWKIIGDGTVNKHYIDSIVLGVASDDETWTNSIFIKKADADVIWLGAFFTTGTTVASASIFTFSTKSMGNTNFEFEELANGIFRVWSTFTNNATGNTDNRIRVYTNDGTSEASSTSVYVWGSMMTPKAFITPYVKTIDATPVTVAGDVTDFNMSDINIPDLTKDWSMKWTGTPYFEDTNTSEHVIYNHTDTNNWLDIYIWNSLFVFAMRSGGTPSYLSIPATITSGTEIAIEIKCESGVVTIFKDGVAKNSGDYSALLDVPIADKTYLASGVATPNSNSVIYTKLLTWEEL